MAQENASSALTSEERQEMLAIHNEWRERVGTPPLKWSVRLSFEAEKWADTLVAEDTFEHSPTPRWYSQNMAMGNSTVSATVQQWTDELPFFDRKSNSCKGDAVITSKWCSATSRRSAALWDDRRMFGSVTTTQNWI
jgi:Cysteine-rich secretory protein family